ncbi:MAG: DUF4012 domain-containing protein [Patescibacteria group bacterium]|nr:DUF4012 domain-containing protein [Patescibacteria group bacterium]
MDYYTFQQQATNFLDQQINRPRWRKVKIGLTIFFCLILILIGFSIKDLFLIKNVIQNSLQAKDLIVTVQNDLMRQDYQVINQNIDQADYILNQQLSALDRLLILDKLPMVRRQVFLIENFLMLGQNTTQTLKIILPIADNLLQIISQAQSLENVLQDQRLTILNYLEANHTQLILATEKINVSQELIQIIDDYSTFKQAEELIDVYVKDLKSTYKLVGQIVDFLNIAPQALGYPQEKNYLIILQNNNELRPTGGFIGSYGILKLQNAEIKELKIDDVYNLDKLVEGDLNQSSPEPLCQHAHWCDWYLRDANWWPDFPTSAQNIIHFYQLERQVANLDLQQIDGVIAINPEFVVNLVELIGPIKINNIEFSSDNFVQLLQEEVEMTYYEKGIPQAERKEILNDLYAFIFKQILSLPLEKYLTLVNITQNNINQRNLTFYFTDQNLQNYFEQHNCTGEIKNLAGDYLMLVDTNLRSLKTDRLIQRQINYQVYPDEDDLIVQLKIHYTNLGQNEDWQTDDYRNYVRIYLPKDIGLIDSYGFIKNEGTPASAEPLIYTENNKTVLAGLIMVPLGQEKEIGFTYRLPKEISQFKDYNLYIQKQSGMQNVSLNVDLKFNKKISQTKATDVYIQQINQQQVKIENNLKQDLAIEINF